MQYYIPQRGRPAWNAHDSDIKQAFGLDPKAKWPAEGMPPRQLVACVRGGGHVEVKVWVSPLNFARLNGEFHRCMAQCPGCGMVLSAGRLHQHRCAPRVRREPEGETHAETLARVDAELKVKHAKAATPLDKGFVEAVYGPMQAVWQAIAEEGLDVADNSEAIELVLDADRLTTFGYKQADDLIEQATKVHGYAAVDAYLTKHVQLL